jgi:hypothetical protein
LSEQRLHFELGQHYRQPHRALGSIQTVEPGQCMAQGVAIQEPKRCEGLILSGGRYMALRSKMVEKRSDFGRAHFRRVALAGEIDESLDPVDIGFFGATAVVSAAYRLAHAVEQARALRACRKPFFRFRRLSHFLLPNTDPNIRPTVITR